MIKVENLTKIYDDINHTKGIDNVNISFPDSGFISLVGPSGCGKSTLLNLLGGLDTPTKGDIYFDDFKISNLNEKQLSVFRNKTIGFVFQSYLLVPYLTVLDNILISLRISNNLTPDTTKKALEYLDQLGLTNEKNKYPNELSGGQSQKVAIIRAIINDAKVILADEPTGALDIKSSKIILDILKEISKERLVIMVTHSQKYASTYSDRILELEDGVLIIDSNQEEIKHNSNNFTQVKTKSKVKLSFFVALHHMVKKKLKLLTMVLANSIGLICLSLVLSINNGINYTVKETEKSTLSSFPITVSRLAYDVPLFSSTTTSNRLPGLLYVDETIETITNVKHLNNFTSEYLTDVIGQIDPKDVEDIKYDYGSHLNIYKEIEAVVSLYMGINATPSYDITNVANTLGFAGAWMELPTRSMLDAQYNLISGHIPTKYDELLLIMDKDSQLSSAKLKLMGIGLDMANIPKTYTYEEIINQGTYKIVRNDDIYEFQGNKFKDNRIKQSYGGLNINMITKDIFDKGIDLKICGIVETKPQVVLGALFQTAVAYHPDLIKLTKGELDESDGFGKNSLIGKWMSNDTTKYINPLLGVPYNDYLNNPLIGSIEDQHRLDSIQYGAGEYIEAIKIFPKSIAAKNRILKQLNAYNDDPNRVEKDKMYFVDYVAFLSDSIVQITNSIELVLIVISIIVMISSLTMSTILFYNDVIERKKEIGIYKSLGMANKNISLNFLIEHLFIGVVSSLVSITISFFGSLLLGNYLHQAIEVLPKEIVSYSLLIAGISTLITIIIMGIASFIPTRKAVKLDPLVIFRTE